jgi:hypothetical protein
MRARVPIIDDGSATRDLSARDLSGEDYAWLDAWAAEESRPGKFCRAATGVGNSCRLRCRSEILYPALSR